MLLILCFVATLLFPGRALALAASANPPTSAVYDNNHSNKINCPRDVSAEVVGGSGRIGSLLLTSTSRAVPKGIAPGCFSSPGTPIYVATPSRCWPSILQRTPRNRREDLVWVGNGLPPSCGTVVVPHFGVLQIDADPVTSPDSPPTYIFGKHAKTVQDFLQSKNIQTQLVDSFPAIEKMAAQKLLWASSYWLLCHSKKGRPPRTVVQIPDDELEPLIREELFPALCARLPACRFQPEDCDTCIRYLKQYSKSMPQAIPKKDMCREEWVERNAFFLKVRDKVPQPRHEELLRTVGEISQEEMDTTMEKISILPGTQSQEQLYDIPMLGLSVAGQKANTTAQPVKSALIVGGGILGSSVALHLARKGIHVQVVDVQSANDVGKTTPASWAWLNANGKSPPEYAWLNQMGMDGWRRDPILKHLPSWNGALVRFGEPQTLRGGYRVEGPLDNERLQALEPLANLEGGGSVYWFPDEGFVDPSAAVRTIRDETTKLGVTFIGHINVTGFTKNQSQITGVKALSAAKEVVTMEADVVILAAGVGMSDLGKIPLLYRPGQIIFAEPSERRESQVLKTILVDTIRESHVLQRKDGICVIGGGVLEVGGKGSGTFQTCGKRQDSPLSAEDTILGRVRELVPALIGDLLRSEKAVRPIPLDGLPAIGYIEPGLYAVVSHSGVTLAPILGALAATEVVNGAAIETLANFRPTRFTSC